MAATNGSAAMLDMLLAAGADPNAGLPEGETPLMRAARAGRVGAVRALLRHGAEVDAAEQWRGQTALMWAAIEGNATAVLELVAGGADVRARSAGGFTPLLFAVRHNRPGVLRALVGAGADVNDTLPDGMSALCVATLNARYDVGVWLLEQGRTRTRRAGVDRVAPARLGPPAESRLQQSRAHPHRSRLRPRVRRGPRRLRRRSRCAAGEGTAGAATGRAPAAATATC